MQKFKTASVTRGGALPKTSGALLALMMLLALALAPAHPSLAYADDPALSVGLAAGTHQGNGTTTFDVLTGNTKTLYAQVQDASMGDKALVQGGFRVAEEGADGNEADFEHFTIKWYKDSVSDENLISTASLGWNSWYNRPQWGSDIMYSPSAPQAAGTYKFYAVASWELEGYQSAVSDPLEFTLNVTDPVVSDITAAASPQEGGTVAFKVGGTEVTQAKTGDEVTVVATPAEGYTLGEISVKDAEGADVSYSSYWESFDMPASAVTVTVTFQKVVTSDIKTLSSEHGTVVYTVSGSEVTQAKTGDTVRISVTPEYGFVRGSISAVDAEGNEVAISKYNGTFTMPSSQVSVTVTYIELPKYDVLKAADIDTATGDISFDRAQFTSGDTIKVTIAPAEGYELGELTLSDPDGNAIQSNKWGDYGLYCEMAEDGLSATIMIQNYWHLENGGQNTNLVVGATFKIAPTRYEIGLAELGEGMNSVTFKVDGSTATKAAEGDVVTIFQIVNYGFDLDAVSVVDEAGQPVETKLGTASENGGKYYFTMPAGKVTVTVTAVAPSYSVVVDKDIKGGTIALAEGSSATFTATDLADGDFTVKFDIVADPGYEFDEDSFSVVDEDGWEVDSWSGVSWDAAAGTVTFDDYVLDGTTRTFTVKGEFVSKFADLVSEIGALDEQNPDAAAVEAARAHFDELSADDKALLGPDAEAKLLKAEIAVAKTQVAELESAKAAAEAELASATEQSQELTKAKEEAEAKIAELESAKSAAEAELASATAQNQELAKAKEEADAQIKDLESAKSDAEAELGQVQDELGKANAELSQAQANLEKTNADLDQATKELSQKDQELNQVKEDLGKAQSSASDAEATAKNLEAATSKITSLESELAAAKAQGKADNPLTVKAKTVKAKKGKKTNIKAAKAFEVKGAQGKVTYAKLSGNDKITVKANGKVVVKKGLKKKTYKVKVMVVAAGNDKYAPLAKTVTLKIKVK